MPSKDIIWNSHGPIHKHSLTLFLGLGFTSTSPLSIIKQLHSHTSAPRRILSNRKIEIYNFELIFETKPFENRNAMRDM